MAGPRLDALTPRQRQCLDLVAREYLSTKEIADRLGLAPGTVDNYIREAVEALGARNRRDAARLLLAADTPRQSHVHSSGDDDSASDEPTAAPPQADGSLRRALGGLLRFLPLRPPETRFNTMRAGKRLGWIVLLALAMMFAFGQLAFGLRLASDLIRSIGTG